MKYLLLAASVAMMATSAYAEYDKEGGKRGHHGKGGHHGKMLKMMDTDGNGAVSKKEMMDFHTARFEQSDANGDGEVTKEEFKAAMEKMRRKHKGDKFKRLDANGDGQISEEEFKAHKGRHGGKGGKGRHHHGGDDE